MRPAIPYVVAALLFGLGVYGVLRRRNAVLVLMSVELMLNAVNLLLVTADAAPLHAATGRPAPTVDGAAALPLTGQAFTLFVIVIAAAEVGVGLAIVLQLYRLRGTVTVDDVRLDTHTPDTGPRAIVEAPAPGTAVTAAERAAGRTAGPATEGPGR
ncbi:NADH-quinone oxidoreductase subunit NuoK [Plantactinospora endophytica]|uniref:NADH-quinone oxidoreductase subunit K n=1 Tax=Plantactinospora endophytica TaxID=673535 RepID=A0ABQ4E4T9_9ACTN|nr:NADH-quinone oxidoreductase subunit NuoK [Plantactinospora endophytica]GIG89726.1 NADH-quinone oxidoreductase subunit K 1 [Plantactinospora endophytica]